MNADFMRRYYRCYNSENPQALRDFYHDEVELTNGNVKVGGIEELMATYSNMVRQFHDKMTPLFIQEDGDSVLVEIEDRLTAKSDIRDFLGQSLAEGEHTTLRLRGVYRFEDKKIRAINLSQSD